jgi:hypothetical protein
MKTLSRRWWIGAFALMISPWLISLAYDRARHVYLAQRAFAMSASTPPFTLSLTETVQRTQNGTGQPIVTAQFIIAQRSDGAISKTEVFYPNTPSEHRVRSITLPDMTFIEAWDGIGMRTTWRRKSETVEKARRSRLLNQYTPESGCMMTVSGATRPNVSMRGRERIDGIEAVILAAVGEDVIVWRSPQMACEEVHMRRTFPDQLNERHTTSWNIGEPAPELFDFSTLKEASPLTTSETQLRKSAFPEDFIQLRLKRLQRRESQYLASRTAGM